PAQAQRAGGPSLRAAHVPAVGRAPAAGHLRRVAAAGLVGGQRVHGILRLRVLEAAGCEALAQAVLQQPRPPPRAPDPDHGAQARAGASQENI
ncbi:hypothetical protein GGI06_000802, partial [Coemansia sp. S85]